MIHSFYNPSLDEYRDCEIRSLDESYLDTLLDFQSNQFKKIQNKDTYKPFTRDDCSFLFENGFFNGVFFNQELVYFIVCIYPGNTSDNLGIDLGLDNNMLLHVAHLEAGIARDDFRGFGLHQYMIRYGLSILEKDSRTKYVCCTVSPFNLPSLKPVLKAGLEIALLKEKYGGSLRYILVKKFD